MAKSIRWIIPVTLLLLATIWGVIPESSDGIAQAQVAVLEVDVPLTAEAPPAQPAAPVPAPATAPAVPSTGSIGLAGPPELPAAAPAPTTPRDGTAAPPAIAPPPPTAPPAAIVPGLAPTAEPAGTTVPPRSRAESSGKNPPTNKHGSAPGKTTAETAEVGIFPMTNKNADAVVRMLEIHLDPEESDGVRATIDPHTNSVILRGNAKEVENVLKLLQQLDRQQAPPQAKYADPNTVPARPAIPYITSTDAAQWPVPYRVNSEAEARLRQEFARLDKQSSDLANEYLKGAETLGSEHPVQKRRRVEIVSAVSKAFDARQDIQTQEVKQLKDRLEKVGQSIAKRSKNREEIIAKRVRDLLEDDRELEWNAASGTNGSSYYSPRAGTFPVEVPKAKSLYPSQGATVDPPPSEHLVEAARQAGVAVQWNPASNQWSDASPSQILGLSSSDSNQPTGADQRQALEAARERLLREESKVAAIKKKLSEFEQPVVLEEDLEYQQAVRDLESAKRQLNHAKRESETVLKLLTLDLQLAKEQLGGVQGEFAAANSKDTRAKLSAAVRQAELRVERAQMLLEHHSNMLKSTDQGSEQAVPSLDPRRR